MFRHTVPIGKIFGIPIELDYSWFLIFGLLTWILAATYYPIEYADWSRATYWVMAAITAVMFFVCVLLHELGHCVIAIYYKIPVSRITFFIFGGVSQIEKDPASPGAEFLVAIAGPMVSFILALFFWEIWPMLDSYPPFLALAKYLTLLNFSLGVFNLLPGFPLDGGRVLRAIVWGANHNSQRATIVAAVVGRLFGFLLICIGIWLVFRNNFFNGLWLAFIGWFLESAAAAQIQQQVGGQQMVQQ